MPYFGKELTWLLQISQVFGSYDILLTYISFHFIELYKKCIVSKLKDLWVCCNEILIADNLSKSSRICRQTENSTNLKGLIFYASFGAFCVQIGQFFEAQWFFEKCLKTLKSLFSKENDVNFEFFRKFKISLCLE